MSEQQHQRIYLGKPENQRDPRAFNPRKPKEGPPPAQAAAPNAAPKQQKGKPGPVPSKLPPGSRASQPQPKREDIPDKSPFADNVFQEDMSVREVNLQTVQAPTLASSNELSRNTFQNLLIDDANLNKQWTPEVFDYYSTCMLWLRIVHLKAKNQQPLTPAEETLLTMTSSMSFNLPEPLRLYLSGIGNTMTKTGQHLYPTFPPLPTTVVDTIPGLYGPIDEANHNLYEEIPAIGVSVGMIRASLNPARPLPQWAPPIVPEGFAANPNLLGFRAVRAPRSEATSITDSAGITPDHFPNYPTNTGFNMQLLKAVSAVIANTDTFKVTATNFAELAEAGSPAQAIISRPIGNDDPLVRTVNSELRAESLTHEALGLFGQSMVFNYQLFKEPVNDVHTTWACVTPPAAQAIPPEWIANRNERRNIPAHYLARVFNSVSLNAGEYRRKIVEKLAKTKR